MSLLQVKVLNVDHVPLATQMMETNVQVCMQISCCERFIIFTSSSSTACGFRLGRVCAGWHVVLSAGLHQHRGQL